MLQDDVSRLFWGRLDSPSPRIPQAPLSQPLLDLLQRSALYLPLPVVGEFHFAMTMAMFTSVPHTYNDKRFFIAQRVWVFSHT